MKTIWITSAMAAILGLGLVMIALELVIWPFNAVKCLANRAYNFMLNDFDPL